jgi:N-acetylmuramoyl-L-alanine amidase
VTAPLVVLDRGHAGKPANLEDRGASAEHEGVRYVEALLTPLYLLAMEEVLLGAGCRVLPVSSGSYAERQALACAVRADLYLQGHLDAGGGRHASLCYDRRSGAGRRLAQVVAERLQAACPELDGAHAQPCWDDRADKPPPERPWRWRAWSCIEGVYQGTPAGLVLEPAFVDQPAHLALLQPAGLVRVGRALAEGVVRYLEAG